MGGYDGWFVYNVVSGGHIYIYLIHDLFVEFSTQNHIHKPSHV